MGRMLRALVAAGFAAAALLVPIGATAVTAAGAAQAAGADLNGTPKCRPPNCYYA